MLIWAAVGFLVGAVLALPLPLGIAVLGAVGFLAASYRIRRSRLSPALLLLAFLLLGSARASHTAPSLGDIGRLNGRTVELQGTVAEEPDIRDSGANYVVSVSSFTSGARTQPLHGKVEIHTSRAVTVEYGDTVLLRGKLEQPRNDSALPYRSILARRGIASTMRFPRMLDLGPSDTGPGGWIVRLRQALEAGINIWLPEPEAALLIAIALGARSASLGDMSQPLVVTGLIHIIAISGIKVAMVAGTAYALLRRLPTRLATLLSALALLAMYVLLTGHTVSGERSAVMWAMVFIAAYLGRGTVSWLSLLLVAAVMVAIQPNLTWDTGFQMTTLGTASIVAFSDRLTRTFWFIVSPFREAFCVTLAAQAGTLPVVMISFHVLSAWGPVANALVLPLLPLLIALGFALGALSALPLIAPVMAAFAYGLLHAVLLVSSILASLPGAMPVTTVASPVTVVYYALLAALSLWALRRVNWAPPGRYPSAGKDLAFGVSVGAVILSGSVLPMGGSPTRLQWLGTGESVLLESAGRTALIDGSPRPLQLLEALGAELGMRRTIDVVMVTDPRSNFSGLLEVLRHYTVGEVLDVGCEYPSLTYARWRAALRDRGISVYALRTGTSLRVGSVPVTAIGPDGVYPQPRDSIGLLRLRFSHQSVLLAGASSTREQTEAVFRPVRLGADTMVIDQGTHSPAAFLRHVNARRVVHLQVKAQRLRHEPITLAAS